jgi:diphthine synthase
VRCDTLERLRKIDFGDPMHVLVVLSRLHFTEFEYLRVFASAPDDLENFVE